MTHRFFSDKVIITGLSLQWDRMNKLIGLGGWCVDWILFRGVTYAFSTSSWFYGLKTTRIEAEVFTVGKHAKGGIGTGGFERRPVLVPFAR